MPGEPSPDAATADGGRSDTTPTRTLFRAMLVEEWRMHASLFGGRRFAAFPVFVALLTAAGVQFVTVAGVDMPTVVAGVHALVFLFGLQTGTVAYLGQDAMRNLLGDVTLLAFNSRTLPLSRRRTLGVLLVKELVYYGFLFLVPLTVAFVPAVLAGALSPLQVPLLWGTLTATFAYGIAVTMALVAVSTRGVPGKALLLALAAAAGLAWAAGVNPLAFTPYAVFATAPAGASGTTSAASLAGLLPLPVLAALAARLYDPEYERPSRTAGDTFGTWQAGLRRIGDDRGLVTRSLLDVHRSSGGFVKVGVSAGVLFAVSAFLVKLVAPLLGTRPSTGVTFGALLGLSAFTTFNWLTQFDDPGEYLRLPLGLSAVFAAKLRAFLLLSVPVGMAFLGVAVVWLGGRPSTVAVGALLLVGFQVYLFGLVVFLSGFSANEFLFDTVLFAGFGVAISVPLVPVLVVGLVVSPVPPVLQAALALGSVLVAGVGIVLYRRAVPKWERAHRSGEL